MIQIISILLSAILFSPAIYPQTKKIESLSTELALSSCEIVNTQKKPGIDFIVKCNGVGSYHLIYSSGLLYDKLSLVTPNDKQIELDLWAKIKNPSHPQLGRFAEWRFIKDGEKINPVALIVSAGAFQGTHTPKNSRSYLVVIKLTPTADCITDFVNSNLKNSDTIAQKLADNSAEKPCL